MKAAIPVAHFARATTTFDAILLLADGGFGSQAVMLNRVLFELVVNAWWTRIDAERTDKQFVGFAQLDSHLRWKKAREYPDLVGPVDDQPELPADHLDELNNAHGWAGYKGWTGRTLRQRIDDLKAAGVGPEPSELRKFYDVITYLTNQELHGSSWSIARVVRRVAAADGERVQFRLAPEQELVDPALRFAWWTYSHMLHLVVTEFDLPIQDGLIAAQARVQQAFSAVDTA